MKGTRLAAASSAGLARPGGNATGLSIQGTDTVGKRVELLRDVIPSLRRLAIMANVDNSAVVLEMRQVQAVARTLGLEGHTLELRSGGYHPALEALKSRADALYICPDPLTKHPPGSHQHPGAKRATADNLRC